MKKILFNISFLFIVLGGISWGLIAVGSFLGRDLNLVAKLSAGNITIEYILYSLIGIFTLVFVFLSRTE